MKVVILGGDKRMLYCAKAFCDDGFDTSAVGFDKLTQLCSMESQSVSEAIGDCDIAVLPLMPEKDGALFSPFSDERIEMEELSRRLEGKKVFSGFADRLVKFGINARDYSAREEFLIPNAALTAEGALRIAMSESEGGIFGSKALVLGYGRIGRSLSRMLKSLGAYVTVAVRRKEAASQALSDGMDTVDFSFEEKCEYDHIFNTVPAPVLFGQKLRNIAQNAVVIDLASGKGGVDFDCAEKSGIKAIHALALPGKYAPKAAGRIIKNTITSLLQEE